MEEGVLAVWTDVPPQAEAAFNAWYDRQHLLERRDIPGFRFAARYHGPRARPRYFAWYRTESPAILGSPAYLERVEHPTPETRAIMPRFRETVRTVFAVRHRAGREVGGVLVTCRMAASPGRAADLDRWAAETALPAALALDGVVAGDYWVAVPDPGRRAGDGPSAEAALRAPDGSAERAIVLQATTPAAAAAALSAVLATPAMRAEGVCERRAGIYRLLCLA